MKHMIFHTLVSDRLIVVLMLSEHFFQLYHGEKKLHFDDMMKSTLYWTNMLSRIL